MKYFILKRRIINRLNGLLSFTIYSKKKEFQSLRSEIEMFKTVNVDRGLKYLRTAALIIPIGVFSLSLRNKSVSVPVARLSTTSR